MMQEKILNEIANLERDYLKGKYTGEEYHSLLNELNNTTWLINKFDLADMSPMKIQLEIHKKQDSI